jgi:hypothetical protein
MVFAAFVSDVFSRRDRRMALHEHHGVYQQFLAPG